MEIVSLVGTLTQDGQHHLHMSLSKVDGSVVGGHVLHKPLIVFTTAEVILGEAFDLEFSREFDAATGFDELVVHTQVKS